MKKLKILFTLLLFSLLVLFRFTSDAYAGPVGARLAVEQVHDSIFEYGLVTWLLRNAWFGQMITAGLVLVIVSLWWGELYRALVKIGSLFAILLFVACGPAKVLPLETVGPNETAFVIPLEGDTAAQEKFESIDYLAKHKVVSKRIEVPVRERSVGRMPWDYEWIPTVRIVKVDRSLVTREWSPDTRGKGEHPISVESVNSIGFRVGVNMTAFITEEDAPTYLYFHTSKPLADVVDQNVRGFLQDKLAREFGQLDLEDCKKKKSAIFEQAEKDTIEHFKKYGITISNIGNAGGLEYEDKRIQDAINDTANAQMEVQVAATRKLAQDEKNKQLVATAKAEADAALEFAKAKEAQTAKVELEIEKMRAQAMVNASEKWNGSTPANILPQGTNMMFGLDGARK